MSSTEIVDLGTLPPDTGRLAAVVDHLRAGGIAVLPTETVYGLSGVVEGEVVERLQRLKGRDHAKPFLLLISGPQMVESLRWTPAARELAEAFWPGPLTLILADPENRFPPGVRGIGGGVGVRISSHPVAQAVVEEVGGPILSTSVNRPGEAPARTAAEALAVAQSLGEVEKVLVVDGGTSPSAEPSTVLDCTRAVPALVREGALRLERLREVIAEIRGGSGSADARAEDEPALSVPAGPSAPVGEGARPLRILFVCSGNTCRSPMAAAIAGKLAERAEGRRLEFRSAGTGAPLGAPASEGALRAARRHGLSLEAHHSVPLDERLVAWADLILAMSWSHLHRVRELGGAEKAALLGTLARVADAEGDVSPARGISGRMPEPRAGDEVLDPFGGGDDVYEETYQLLEKHLRKILPMVGRWGGCHA